MSDQHVAEMTDDELDAELFQATSEISAIQTQLDWDTAHWQETGEWRDATWRAKAKAAQRFKKLRRMELTKELTKRRKDKRDSIKHERSLSLAMQFMDVAKEQLDGDEFDDLLDEARERVAEA